MVANHSNIDGQKVAETVTRFRADRPHVHCITNAVVQSFTANVLLAAGATPSMTINPKEVEDFVDTADALLVNLGTMDEQRSRAADIAIGKANELSKPWALDPVFVQASSLRLEQAKSLLGKKPALIRCNAEEAKALFETEIDTKLCDIAAEYNCVIALTGRSDTICSADGSISIQKGSALMDRITGMGCALTALMTGFLATEEDPLLAAAAATMFFGLAGEEAERRSAGPGRFVPAFVDALYTLSSDEIAAGARSA